MASKPLFDPTVCEGTECPAGCCPGENWFCCPDNIYCASTAADCPSAAADITGEPTTIAGVAFDPADYFDTSLPPMRFISGATAGEFVVPEWLGFNRAVYINSQGGIADEYVAPRQIIRFYSTIVLGYDPEGSEAPGLPAPPEFTVESVGNQEVGPVYKVSVTPVSGATGYVFRFNGVAIRPTYIGPQLAASALPEGIPAIGENEYLYTTEVDGDAMTAASTNQNGTGEFGNPVQVGPKPCDPPCGECFSCLDGDCIRTPSSDCLFCCLGVCNGAPCCPKTGIGGRPWCEDNCGVCNTSGDCTGYCEADQTCCGGVCCDVGETCGRKGDEGTGYCCPKDTRDCFGTCCPDDRACCLYVCCLDGQVCCNGECQFPPCCVEDSQCSYENCRSCQEVEDGPEGNKECKSFCPANSNCIYGKGFCCPIDRVCGDLDECCSEGQTCCNGKCQFPPCCAEDSQCNYLNCEDCMEVSGPGVAECHSRCEGIEACCKGVCCPEGKSCCEGVCQDEPCCRMELGDEACPCGECYIDEDGHYACEAPCAGDPDKICCQGFDDGPAGVFSYCCDKGEHCCGTFCCPSGSCCVGGACEICPPGECCVGGACGSCPQCETDADCDCCPPEWSYTPKYDEYGTVPGVGGCCPPWAPYDENSRTCGGVSTPSGIFQGYCIDGKCECEIPHSSSSSS